MTPRDHAGAPHGPAGHRSTPPNATTPTSATRPATASLDRRRLLQGLFGLGALGLTGGLAAGCSRLLDGGDAAAGQGAAGGQGAGEGTSPAGADGADPGDPRLRVGYLPITDATPLLAAHGLGLYEDQGLEVARPTLLRSWAQVAEAFQSRQVDLVHLLMPMAVQLRFASDFPLRIVAWNHTGGSGLTVANGIDEVGELAGTTVAIPFWHSIHNTALQLLLEDADLTPIVRGQASASEGTVKLVVMAPPDMPPALAQGSISGYIVADPFNAVAEVQGIGKVLRFTGDVWLDHACCVSVMHHDALEERPEWSRRTVEALVRAQAAVRDDRSGTAELLSEAGEGYLPQPQPAIERALSYYDLSEYTATGAIRHPDWQTSRIGFQPFPFPSYTEELVRRMQATEVDGDRRFLDDLDPAAVHADLVHDRDVRAAIDAVGGPGVFDLPDDLSRTETIDV
jgi:NitT/TauT family transport system substrate-binding protein